MSEASVPSWITNNAGDFTASIYIHFVPSLRISADRKGEFPTDKHDSIDRKQILEGNQYHPKSHRSKRQTMEASNHNCHEFIHELPPAFVSQTQREETTKPSNGNTPKAALTLLCLRIRLVLFLKREM